MTYQKVQLKKDGEVKSLKLLEIITDSLALAVRTKTIVVVAARLLRK